MGGGILQLAAYGSQDEYLTGNPDITFFKVVYRKYTNFSMEVVEQNITGKITNGINNVESTIGRVGDLVHNMWLDINIPSGIITGGTNVSYTYNTGHAYIDEISVLIGDQEIDKHYGHYLDVYTELNDLDNREEAILNRTRTIAKTGLAGDKLKSLQLYVPLKFWFNKHPGLAVPLVCLQYHDLKIKLLTRKTLDLFNATDGTIALTNDETIDTKLYANYIFLDTEERRRFAQTTHDYLIEQLQYNKPTYKELVKSASVELVFNHPIKELIWTIQNNTVTTSSTTTIDSMKNQAVDGDAGTTTISNANDYFYYGVRSGTDQDNINNGNNSIKLLAPFSSMTIKMNNTKRFPPLKASYFKHMERHRAGYKINKDSTNVFCYSFSLKPGEYQPSGTCNFSRLDSVSMEFTKSVTNSQDRINVYAINYNILRIMSGMGGLAYSN